MQKIFGNVGRQAKVIAAANIHKIEQHSDAPQRVRRLADESTHTTQFVP